MSWTDILYPGNPERRDRVVVLHQQLIDSMELNFDGTNELIKILNTHFQSKLQPIEMNKHGTVRENCDIFLTAMKAVQDILQGIDGKLKSKLDPDLYRKLHNFEETDATKMQILRDVGVGVSGLTGVVATGIFVKLALSQVAKRVLSQMATIMAKVAASTIGAVAGALLGVSFDLIFSAILGARERSELEKEIQELDKLVSEFQPASKEYYRTILKVSLTLSEKEEN